MPEGQRSYLQRWEGLKSIITFTSCILQTWNLYSYLEE